MTKDDLVETWRAIAHVMNNEIDDVWSLDEAYVKLDELVSELSRLTEFEISASDVFSASEFLAKLEVKGLDPKAAKAAAEIERVATSNIYDDDDDAEDELSAAEEARQELQAKLLQFIAMQNKA